MMRKIDFGNVEVSDTLLLEWLQLADGELQMVQWNPETRTLLLRIQHEEMPKLEVIEGVSLSTVKLTFAAARCGHVCDLGSHEVITRQPIKSWGYTNLYDYRQSP